MILTPTQKTFFTNNLTTFLARYNNAIAEKPAANAAYIQNPKVPIPPFTE